MTRQINETWLPIRDFTRKMKVKVYALILNQSVINNELKVLSFSFRRHIIHAKIECFL